MEIWIWVVVLIYLVGCMIDHWRKSREEDQEQLKEDYNGNDPIVWRRKR